MHKTDRARQPFLLSFILIICICVTAVFLFASMVITPSHQHFNNEEVFKFQTSWYSESGEFLTDTLPAHFPCDETGTVTVYTTLPEQDSDLINTLAFRASQNSVRIWINNELLLEQKPVREATPIIGKSPGSSWIMLRLPDDYAGKELRIELSSPYKSYEGYLSTIYLGTKSAILYHIINMHGFSLLISLVMLFLGFLLLLFYLLFFVRKIANRQILLLGIFGILTGIWLFGECHILQFFTGKLIAWFDLTMVALHLLPLPILFIASDLPDFPYRRFCMISAGILTFYLTVVIFLQASGILDFMEILNVSLCILLFFCITVPGLIVWDYLYHKNKKIYSMTVAITVLGIFSCIELVYDLIALKIHVGSFIQIGVFAFYLIVSLNSIRQAVALFEKGMQTSYYRKLSYSDQMTNCQNRRAFTERENSWQPGQADALIMIDLNHLKQINDTLGHHVGDAYITACSNALHEVFHKKGTCYRLGGDEFLFWGNHLTEAELHAMEQHLKELVKYSCRSISPLCGVATGAAVLLPEDHTIADTMLRADVNMYEAKRIIKAAEITEAAVK